MVKREYVSPSLVVVNVLEEEFIAATKEWNVDKPGSGGGGGEEDNRSKEVNSDVSSWGSDWAEWD